MLAYHYTEHKYSYENKPLFVQHKDDVLSHASVAKYGMAQFPVNIMFSVKESYQCLLFPLCNIIGIHGQSINQSINQLPIMIRNSSGRQLDLMLKFLAGLLGNVCQLISRITLLL